MVAFEGEGVWVVATAVEQVAVVVGLQVMGAFVAGPTAGRNQAQRHFRKQSHPIRPPHQLEARPPCIQGLSYRSRAGRRMVVLRRATVVQ